MRESPLPRAFGGFDRKIVLDEAIKTQGAHELAPVAKQVKVPKATPWP